MILTHYRKAALLDASAMTMSGLCAIHCLALPFIATILPLAGIIAEAEWIHKALVLAALPFTGLALYQSRNNPRLMKFAWLGLAGLVLLIAAAFVSPLEAHEKLLTITGAITLATGHFLRWKNHAH